jgi:hypothetical protein
MSHNFVDLHGLLQGQLYLYSSFTDVTTMYGYTSRLCHLAKYKQGNKERRFCERNCKSSHTFSNFDVMKEIKGRRKQRL